MEHSPHPPGRVIGDAVYKCDLLTPRVLGMLHEGGPLTAQAQLIGQRRGKHNKLFHTTVRQLYKSIETTHLTTDSW